MTETAVANGDTRTIHLYHAHTHESISATYLVNGQYDSNVLRQLNWFLRDWRRDEPTNMDPRLFDVVWEAYRSAGASNEVVHVVSAYRSPETNAMLRSRSRAVAKYSQHMLGKAMDTTMPGMTMSNIREIGMRMQRGGVGYYPTAGTPFVHLDVGNVRSWPRMSYDQLVRLFPDGKTVHLPTNGQPLARYEEARAEIEARGNGAYVTAPRRTVGGFFAMLFGGGGEEDDAEVAAPAPSTRKQWASLAPRRGRGAKGGEADEEGGAPIETDARQGRTQTLARAEADLPRGEASLSAPGAEQQEQERPMEKSSAVRAPLPPQRPASLDGRSAGSAAVASLEAAGARDLRSSVDFQQAEGADATSDATRTAIAPLPPRRPTTLLALAAHAPLPPTRPAALDANASNAIATLMDASGGDSPQAKPATDGSLAYASEGSARADQPAPPKRPQETKREALAKPVAPRSAVVPARLDRSNFHALTDAAPTSHTAPGSVMGSSISGVRSAARARGQGALIPSRSEHVAGFAEPGDSPPVDKFAPGAERSE